MRVVPHFTNMVKCDYCETILTDYETGAPYYVDSPIIASEVHDLAEDSGWYVRYEGHEPFLSCPECHGGPIGS